MSHAFVGLRVTEELTSMPVPSASPLSAFVLVLGGFELGETSVATDMIEVSPSIFDGAVEADMAGVAAGSAGPVADAVRFRGMAVPEGWRCAGEGEKEEGRGTERSQSNWQAQALESAASPGPLYQTRRFLAVDCRVKCS